MDTGNHHQLFWQKCRTIPKSVARFFLVRQMAGRLSIKKMKNKSTYLWSTLQPNIKVDTSLNVNLQNLTNGGVGKLVSSLQDILDNTIWSFFMVGQPANSRLLNHKNHYIMLSKSSCNDCTNFLTSPLVRKCRFTFNEVSIMMFG